jgi:hypothetical protein
LLQNLANMKTKSLLPHFRVRIIMLLAAAVVIGATAFISSTTVEIQVSPNVLNLANSGEVVTIHTDLPYTSVIGSSVTLNGVEISWWKSDAQGNFVAKFEINAIKALFSPGTYTLELTGSYYEAGILTDFTGSQLVKVISVKGK